MSRLGGLALWPLPWSRREAATSSRLARDGGLSIAVYMHDLAGGGVERQNLKLAREFRTAGHRVTLLLHSEAGELSEAMQADIPRVVLGGRSTLGDVPRLAAWLMRNRPDILLASLDYNNVAALLAKALSFTPTRTVICQHNGLFAEASGNSGRLYALIPHAFRALSPLARGVVAVSTGVADDLAERARIARRRIVVIHNPVIDPEFDQRVAEPVNHPWFDGAGPPVYVTAGRLAREKDHATLLKGFALHLAQREARLLVLGVGPLRVELEALTRSLGIAHAVEFAGFKPNPLPYMRRAAAFVLSSRFEGFGNVLIEAMGCGTPVIATDCPFGPREALGDGRFGILVPTGHPEALAAAMGEDLRARWPAEVLRARAREFTDAACAAQYLGLFARLMRHPATLARGAAVG